MLLFRSLQRTNNVRLCAAVVLSSISSSSSSSFSTSSSSSSSSSTSMEIATVAGGCFWCVEAPYNELKGVQSAISGYIGGNTKNPTYREVCNGDTGHAEAVRVTFDPNIVSFEQILDVFFTLHDPTQLNRQGNDMGTQYRSAIFYHSPSQLQISKQKISELEASGKVKSSIVTQLEDVGKHIWYPGEEYHQCYVKNNPTQGYVAGVSIPKLEKVRRTFPQLMKKDA